METSGVHIGKGDVVKPVLYICVPTLPTQLFREIWNNHINMTEKLLANGVTPRHRLGFCHSLFNLL